MDSLFYIHILYSKVGRGFMGYDKNLPGVEKEESFFSKLFKKNREYKINDEINNNENNKNNKEDENGSNLFEGSETYHFNDNVNGNFNTNFEIKFERKLADDFDEDIDSTVINLKEENIRKEFNLNHLNGTRNKILFIFIVLFVVLPIVSDIFGIILIIIAGLATGDLDSYLKDYFLDGYLSEKSQVETVEKEDIDFRYNGYTYPPEMSKALGCDNIIVGMKGTVDDFVYYCDSAYNIYFPKKYFDENNNLNLKDYPELEGYYNDAVAAIQRYHASSYSSTALNIYPTTFEYITRAGLYYNSNYFNSLSEEDREFIRFQKKYANWFSKTSLNNLTLTLLNNNYLIDPVKYEEKIVKSKYLVTLDNLMITSIDTKNNIVYLSGRTNDNKVIKFKGLLYDYTYVEYKGESKRYHRVGDKVNIVGVLGELTDSNEVSIYINSIYHSDEDIDINVVILED